MNQPPSGLAVAVTDRIALIKVTGRAAFNRSISLKTIVKELNDRGYVEFVLDLKECSNMDSTFLGSMVGIVSSFSQRQQTNTKVCVQLLDPSQRIRDLLENLGVAHLFPICQGMAPTESTLEAPTLPSAIPTKEEISKACLEAHQNLMAVNPENIPRFKDVAQFLADDIKKLKR